MPLTWDITLWPLVLLLSAPRASFLLIPTNIWKPHKRGLPESDRLFLFSGSLSFRYTFLPPLYLFPFCNALTPIALSCCLSLPLPPTHVRLVLFLSPIPSHLPRFFLRSFSHLPFSSVDLSCSSLLHFPLLLFRQSSPSVSLANSRPNRIQACWWTLPTGFLKGHTKTKSQCTLSIQQSPLCSTRHLLY